MTYLLWTRLFGVRFKPHPMQNLLPAEHVNGHRLLLVYVWTDKATRTFPETSGPHSPAAACSRVSATRSPLTSASARSSGACRDPARRAGSNRFWQGDGFDQKLRLPGRSHGLNDWREYHNVALLSIVNLQPEQYTLLHHLGVDGDEVTQVFGLRDVIRTYFAAACGTRTHRSGDLYRVRTCHRRRRSRPSYPVPASGKFALTSSRRWPNRKSAARSRRSRAERR